jgi:general secretion pathway protein K
MEFKKSSGIALIQVLMVSAVFAVLVLSYSHKSRHALSLAEQALARTQGMLALQSAESTVLLGLLTEDSNVTVAVGQFNRYNEPFTLVFNPASSDIIGQQDVQAQVQDLAGLFVLAPFGSEKLPELLQQLGYEKNLAKTISIAMDDWQDTDNIPRTGGAEQSAYSKQITVRNAPFQTESELGYVKGMAGNIPEKLQYVTTFYSSGHLNLMTAPVEVLALYTPDKGALSEVQRKRKAHQLTPSELIRLTGIETNDTILTNPGKGSRITLIYDKAPHNLSLQKEFIVSPYEQIPVTLWSAKRK